MPPDSLPFPSLKQQLREVLMSDVRKGLRAIGDRFGNSAQNYSLSTLISHHRFGDWEKPEFGDLSRRWNGPAQEYRIMVVNAGLTHFDVVPRAQLERYGGTDFADNVRNSLIDRIAKDDYAGEIAGVQFIPFAGPALVAEIMRQITEEVDKALDNPVATWKGKDPARMARQALSVRQKLDEGGFHLGLICEVWHKDEFRNLTGEAAKSALAGSTTYAPAYVPLHAWNAGAGLLALPVSESARLVHTAPGVYGAKGDGTRDIEFYSDKGVQLARIQTPFGFIDFYQTHLHFGGDLSGILESAGGYADHLAEAFAANGVTISDPSPGDRSAVRKRQLDELAGFIETTRLPESIVVVAGDFNIDGCPPHAGMSPPTAGSGGAEYGSHPDLKAFRDRLGLEDAAIRFGLDSVGTLSDAACPRLDYLLVEKPTQKQGLVVDLMEMAVPWLTDAEGDVTDHKALTITIRCTPK